MLRWDLAQTLAQTGSCLGVRPVVAVLPGTPSFRVNSAAPSALSPPVAGKSTHPVTRNAAGFCLIFLCCQVNQFCFYRSSPAETRESQAAEGERLGKRVRKKRKIYMDSGEEEEENQEEPEVRGAVISLITGCARQGRSLASDLLTPSFISAFQEKTKSTKGRRGAKIAKLGMICCSFEIKNH